MLPFFSGSARSGRSACSTSPAFAAVPLESPGPGLARSAGVTLLALLLVVMQAKAEEAPLELSRDGARLDDRYNQLVWQRCAVGMEWHGGRCAGLPLRMSRSEAVQLAIDLGRVEGVRYHLPSLMELQRLHAQLAANPHLVTILAGFAPPPDEWWWTATAVVEARGVDPATAEGARLPPAVAGRPLESAAGHRLPAAVARGWAMRLRTGELRQDLSDASRLPVLLVRSTQGD